MGESPIALTMWGESGVILAAHWLFMGMADRSPPLLGALNIEHRTLNIERRMKEREVSSLQGEVISESPDHVGTMRSDSLNPLAPMGMADRRPPLLGWMNIGRLAVVRRSGQTEW
jgi:hypothetical protein